MADSDKNIIITPNRGQTSQPNIVFTGQGNDPITLRILDGATGTGLTAGGALSFEGSEGQLFSVVNRLGTGSIFSVNNISGIPSIDVDANGTISMASFDGNVGIGLTLPTEKLHVVGNILTTGDITADGLSGISQLTFASGQTADAIVTKSGGATGNVELPRIEWCGLTSGYDIIPTNWANMSAPISTSPTANDAYFVPISISKKCRIKSIGTQNGASSSGNTGNLYFGIYTSNTYGYPDQRLYISPSTALTTGNFGVLRVSNVDTIVDPGFYWLAVVYSASSIPTSGLGRLGARMKWMTAISGQSPIGQGSTDGLRAAQGSFTLLTSQTGPFTDVNGPANPCVFYTAEGI